MIHYRLGLDIGTNSIGWAALHIQQDGTVIDLMDWGVRIYNDGREPAVKDVPGESSAVQRRTARSMRRRYDRLVMRKRNVMKQLAQFGLMPAGKPEQKKLESLNPLQLRHDALETKLSPYEIGRALFHLQQRRGFQSNRKELRQENDAGALKTAAQNLEQQLTLSDQTLGQFLFSRHQKRETTRIRPEVSGSKAMYDFYPTRGMVKEEFDCIWNKQKKYHPELLNDRAYESICRAIFHQRPLKPQPKGKCSLIPEEERFAWAMPSAQHFRIIKEVNNLALLSSDKSKFGQKLSDEQRKILYNKLCQQGSMTFKAMRNTLNLPSEYRFNLEATRDKLLGDKTAHIMRGTKKTGERFPNWDQLPLHEQDNIIARVINDDPQSPGYMEDETLIRWLCEHYHLTPEQAEATAHAPLPDSYARFGRTAITSILPKMCDEGMLEHEAISACGFGSHSQQYTGEYFDELPYYGEILSQHVVSLPKSSDPMVALHGKVNNPTVHIALNQMRRLLNTLKSRYGAWPSEITIEMARNLKNGRQETARIVKEIERNTKQKEKWKEIIEQYKQTPATRDDFIKMKLWEELDPTHRKCVYTGEQIDLSMLLSDAVEVEHILPRSKTLDNTSANLTLATRLANRLKGNKTPYEAFHHAPEGYRYEDIWERAQILPDSKKWRFLPDAMDIFDSKSKKIIFKSSLDESGRVIDTELESFAARQLNDTSYIAKLGKRYLAYACEKGEIGVAATPGTLTGLLRKSWGLNALIGDEKEKNRNDHRHHAIDALIIALTSRSMIKHVADAAKKEEETGIDLVKHIPAPFTKCTVPYLQKRLDEIIVSHKPDHGSPGAKGSTSGQLHEETVYGYVGDGDKKNSVQLVVRKPLESLNKRTALEQIRDKHLRQQVLDYIDKRTESSSSAAAIEAALREFSENTGVRRVRVLTTKSHDTLVTVTRDNKPYKLMLGGSNHRMEIYCPKSGKKAGQWQTEVISTFNANQLGFTPRWKREHPDAELVMVLHSNDMVAYEENEQTFVCRVKKMNSNGRIYLLPHTIAKDEGDKLSRDFSSGKALQKHNLRRLFVEVDGSTYDPLGILSSPPSNVDVA